MHVSQNGGARVAELVDAPALGAGALAWGFDSPLSHQEFLYYFKCVVNPLLCPNLEGTKFWKGNLG